MKTQQILSHIVEEFPEYKILKPVFVIKKELNLILSGYALDRTPSSIYINKFYYPLFDLRENCHLTYGFRLAGVENSIQVSKTNKSDLSKRVISIIEKHKSQNSEISTLVEFTSYIDEQNKIHHVLNSVTKMHYGMAQVLLENYDIAKKSFAESREHIHKKRIPVLNEVENKLNNSPEEAKAFILEQADKMKAQLKLK